MIKPDAREAIEDMLAAGRGAEAAALLRKLWRESPQLGSAGFVRRHCLKLPAWFPVLACKRLAILRSVTIEPLVPLLRTEALLWGVDLVEVWSGGYDSYHTELRGGNDALEAFQPELLLVWPAQDEDEELLNESLRAFRSRHAAPVVVHDVSGVAIDGIYSFPYRQLVARHGSDAWGNRTGLAAHGLPVRAMMHQPLIIEWLKFLLPLCGRQAKVLVTDADEVLWQGVVGEDGVRVRPRIQLQRKLRALRDQGFLLALCSRNNAADVEPMLAGMAGMLLGREDFAAQRVNWKDKATNLIEIAAELNVGIESLLVLDDSPFEREQIRYALPMIGVIDLPPTAAGYLDALDGVPTLHRLACSEEDRARAEYYTHEHRRKTACTASGSLTEYFHLLGLRVRMQVVTAETSLRATQLIQKTNQFNLTGRRYQQTEILARCADPAWRMLIFGAADRHGDYGLIGLIMAEIEGTRMDIDSFVLSCRAMNRGIEQAMLAALVGGSTVEHLVGRYVATAQNAPCAGFLATNGFVRATDDGVRWLLEPSTSPPLTPSWIELALNDCPPVPNSPDKPNPAGPRDSRSNQKPV